MDYKKIIKSRKARLCLLRILSWIPDSTMLKIQYRIKMGRELNLKNPTRYTEKIQWYKLNYKNPLMIQCVDKCDVREYVRKCGYESILTNCYGVFNRVEDINFDELPERFVVKDTLGGGGNTVRVVKAKSSININDLKKELESWLKINTKKKSGGREWPYYSGASNRIIIEEYIPSDINQGGLIDYKFFCFDGEPQYMYVVANRKLGVAAEFGIYDAKFNLLPYYRLDELKPQMIVEKPDNYEEMVKIARKLSAPFPHARIDLYDQDNRIIFGEITFYDGSGYMTFEPDDFDFILGREFHLESCCDGV